MYYILLGLVVLTYFFYQVVIVAVPRFLLVPPHDWKTKIQEVLDHEKSVYLKVNAKRGCYRRRFVLASVAPWKYTNFLNNKVKIVPEDKDDSENFVEAMRNRSGSDPSRKKIYGFFHPYANNGGGGERVLWEAIKATLLTDDRAVVVVYTSNVEASPKDILTKVENKFQIDGIDGNRVVFIYLRKFAKYIDLGYWKHATMVGQLIGSMLLSLEAMYELLPDIWIDTMGLPGSYLFVSIILRIPIMCYVHYPIIQPNMFSKLKYSNFSLSTLKTVEPSILSLFQLGKLFYWKSLYYFYVYLGSLVHIALTNGSWTYNHISSIWMLASRVGTIIDVLYPPCSTEILTKQETSEDRDNKLLYVAQFRPEKRHELILDEYALFLKSYKQQKKPIKDLPLLLFIGSCRTPDDTSTLESLKEKVEELSLTEYVEFNVDCSYADLMALLCRTKFGLNAMWNEHFGIGVVEYLSCGVIPLCHASAGPLLDIVVNEDDAPYSGWHNDTGFFFKSASDPDYDPNIQENVKDGYLNFNEVQIKSEADNQTYIFPELSTLLKQLFIETPELVAEEKLDKMRSIARSNVIEKFSNDTFRRSWMEFIIEIDKLENTLREERSSIEKVY